MSKPAGELLHKVVFVGESGTGKTCIIRQYVSGIFQAADKATIGVDFALKVIPPTTAGGRSITLQVWDVAGQERYGQMTQVYYRGAVGAMCVVDASRPETFEAAILWKQDLDSKVFLPGTAANIPCLLLINKVDLCEPPKSKDEIEAYCSRHGFCGYFACSAKDNTNISEAFDFLMQKMDRGSSAAAQTTDKPKAAPANLAPAPKKKEKDCAC